MNDHYLPRWNCRYPGLNINALIRWQAEEYDRARGTWKK